MIGITIGIGEGWAQLAESSARAMENMTGIRCEVIRAAHGFGVCHPSWLKCHLHRLYPNEDSFLVFDADLLCLGPWEPDVLFAAMGRAFMAVPEPNANPDLIEECRKWGLGFPDTYINCGLMIYGQEHGFVMDRAWTHHPHGGTWLEQTAINHALATEAVEMCRLPRIFNTLAQEGRINSIYCRTTLKDAINVHTCAMDKPEDIIAHHDRLRTYLASGCAGRTREELLWDLRTRFGVGSTGAEIGVFCGDYSSKIANIVSPDTLHLVDIFEGQVTSGNVNGQNMRTVDMAVIAEELEEAGFPFVVSRWDSIEWLKCAGTASLDWVYLDTTHEYERTLAELTEARRVVKPGGIIAGHDFSRAFPGVVAAVKEFIEKHGLQVQIYDGDLLPSYWIEND